jgi:hypothetical protein
MTLKPLELLQRCAESLHGCTVQAYCRHRPASLLTSSTASATTYRKLTAFRLSDSPPCCNDSLLIDRTQDNNSISTSSSLCNATTHGSAAKAAVGNTTGNSSSWCCPVEHADELSYYQFVERYMAPNLPVLIKVKIHAVNITKHTLISGQPCAPALQTCDKVQSSSFTTVWHFSQQPMPAASFLGCIVELL